MFEKIGSAAELVERLYKLKDHVQILEAVAPLRDAINEAQREATAALSRIHELTVANLELEAKLASREDIKALKDKYEVFTFEKGAVAWRLKDKGSGDYPVICANCLENGQKSPLHHSYPFHNCLNCKSRIMTDTHPGSSRR